MDNFDSAMLEAGATYADINTKAYNRIKAAIQGHPEIVIGESLGDAMKEAANLVKALEQQCGNARETYISDTNLKNAVASFNATLNMVKNTFGLEAMTEAVICKAIEAGSYIGYRAIMGEAVPNGKRY